MLIAKTENLLWTAENAVLRAYALDTLSFLYQIEADSLISSLCCESMVLVGTQKGSLCTVNLEKKCTEVLKKMESSVTALFLRGSVLGVGTECGSVCILLVKGTDLEILEERCHTAPVLGIATDGVETCISDMRGRICTFPDQKVYDNFNAYICYTRYLFASESHFLYCKTKEAFAVYLEHTTGNPIQSFFFSRTGSVVFLKEKGKVFVYDFNKKSMINEICISGECVYDEDRNRIIFESRGSLKFVENAADRNLLKSSMNSVFFKELKIEERIVWSESECSDEVVRIRRKKSKKPVSYEFVQDPVEKKVSGEHGKEGREPNKEAPSPRRGRYGKGGDLKDLFKEESVSSEHNSTFYPQDVPKGDTAPSETGNIRYGPQHFMPTLIEGHNGALMCYNTTGYLTSTKDEFFNVVELSYHNTLKKGMQIKDTNFSKFGVFSEEAVLLGTASSLHFYSGDVQWTHKSSEEVNLIGMSNQLIAVVYDHGVLRVYKHSGLEVFNCDLGMVNAVFCHGNLVFALKKESLYKIDAESFSFERFEVLSGVDWVFVDQYVYYRACGKVYVLRKGLSLRVCEPEGHPLCVSDGYLVVLSKNKQFYPEPAVEYCKLKLSHNSSGPNILNCTVFGRDDAQLSRIIKDAESSGRNRLAEDLKMLVYGEDKSLCPAPDKKQPSGHLDIFDGDLPNHYRERENEFWNNKDIAKEKFSGKKEDTMQIRTKKYSPFKK